MERPSRSTAGGFDYRFILSPGGREQVPNGEVFLVFYVKDRLEEKYEELKKRGARFSEEIKGEPFGKTARLRDPDGHDIYLWQPPPRSSKNFKNVSGIVQHYENILSKLEE